MMAWGRGAGMGRERKYGQQTNELRLDDVASICTQFLGADNIPLLVWSISWEHF